MARTWDAAPVASPSPVHVRRIEIANLVEALRLGWRDFLVIPTQLAFLCLIYPLAGLVMSRAAAGSDLLPLIYPMLAGFTLVAPLAALGIYELSRRIEAGETPRWTDMFSVLKSPALGSIIALGIVLLAVFTGWLWAAKGLFYAIMDGQTPASLGELWRMATTTREGLWLLVAGNALGAVFALLVLGMTAVSFPMMLDRGATMGEAVRTSMAALSRNPGVMLAWGVIIAVLLAVGMLTLFVGLAVALPWLGHATWHLYRRLVG
jgi:uncharacterized membrane protein